jgi:chemotaxis protein CheZ
MSHSTQSASHHEPSRVETPDYAEIERSLTATEHGRRFLAEYLERNRSNETRTLLDAVAGLERSLRAAEAANSQKSLKTDITEMFNSFAQTRKEISRLKAPFGAPCHSPFARYAFAEITEAMEHATHAVLEAAEDIQAAVQAIREKGPSERYCMAIERQLTQIHRGCAAHDHTLQRNVKIVELLGHLESELVAIIESWEREGGGADEGESVFDVRPEPLQRQLVENLALSILNETQKQALFT